MAAQQVTDHDTARATVMAAVRDLDGQAVRSVLTRTLRTEGVDVTVAQVVLPVLKHVGDAWESGELSVLHEHFASNTIRGMLGYVKTPASTRADRRVVLACPPRELHDLPLELFGAMLRQRGWHVVNLGANTPLAAVDEAVRLLDADACVLAGVRRSAFQSRVLLLGKLRTTVGVPVFLAGEGATTLPSAPRGTTILPADMRRAAELVHSLPARRRRHARPGRAPAQP
jgi:MerR family transcriptional regulator, light-induced transcriptional regulator